MRRKQLIPPCLLAGFPFGCIFAMSALASLVQPGARVQRRSIVALALVALLAARLIGLLFSQTELFFDEAQDRSWSQDLAFGYFSKPPLIAWIIRGATSVCGDGEACVRAAAPLLYFATSIVLYRRRARIL